MIPGGGSGNWRVRGDWSAGEELPNMNAIGVIAPYNYEGNSVFDDPAV